MKFYLMRHFPSVEDPNAPAVHELATGAVSDVKIADVWAGSGELSFSRRLSKRSPASAASRCRKRSITAWA